MMRRNALMQLLAANRQPYRAPDARIVRAAAGDEATVYLYDAIVGDRATAEWVGGVCPQDMVPALRDLAGVGTIHLRVNSPGGDVFASEAIAQALRDHPGRVVAHIDGLAASAATPICCAADEVVMTRNGQYMIHKAWTLAMGNADDLRATVALLDAVDTQLIDEYTRFTGGDRDQIAAWVGAETWLGASAAQAAGFVHRIAEDAPPRTDARAWNLAAYSNAPTPAEAPAPEPDQHRIRQQQRLKMLRTVYNPH